MKELDGVEKEKSQSIRTFLYRDALAFLDAETVR